MSKVNKAIIRLEIVIILCLSLLCIVIGIAFYHLVEGFRLLDAFYFTTMTLTTVGYGDFTPKTDIGKLFTSLYVYIGIGLFFGLASVIFHGAMHRLPRQRK